MMGTKIRSFAPLPDLSLEELVPKDNFYRRVEAAVDLSFVRDLVKGCYSFSGRPSVDPQVFFKLQLVRFFEDLRSERQLMEVVADRLSLRWYIGYDLHEPLPDHSSLTRIRERYGLPVFRRFFERIVEMCIEAGLVWGKELYFDATQVGANAAKDSLVPRFVVENHLEKLFEEDFSKDEGSEDEGHSLPQPSATETSSEVSVSLATLPTAEDETLRAANAARQDWLSSAGRQGGPLVEANTRRKSDYYVSRTDPDACLMRHNRGISRLGYHTHYVVDGGKARVILDVLVTPANVMENQPMLDLLWRNIFRWKIRPHQVTGDSTYGTLSNIKGVEDAGIRAYTPVIDFTRGERFFGEDKFVYDPQQDLYHCPGGAVLRSKGILHKKRFARYKAEAKACNACTLKPKCTNAKGGRTLRRSLDEHYRDRVRAYHETAAYKKAMRKRQVWVEPMFAEAKQWHGLSRFRLRELERVNTEALLTAAGQNLKRMLTFGSWGPRNKAQAAALRPPQQPLRYPDHRNSSGCRWSSAWSRRCFSTR